MSNTLLTMMLEVKKALFGEDYDTSSEEKFNFAIINKTENGLIQEELWILSNAYYDYDLDKFVKIDVTHTSFGIQIQAAGTYPGEAELGYVNNTGVNFWRCPIWKENASDNSYVVYKDTDYYDYNDMEENNWIGAQYDNSEFWGEKNGTWRSFGVATGWNNNFMTDSYGGVTIGGAGFEIDGNGIFPFTRLTSSIFTDENNDAWYLLGILDNAYHPDQWHNWKCDSNEYGAWFFGLKYPQNNGVKDSENAKFVVMYNDMSSVDPTDNNYTIEVMDVSDWETILEVDSNSIKGMVSGTLTTLGAGGSGTSVDLTNYIQKSQTNGLLKNDGTVDSTQYLSQHQDITGKLDIAQTNYKGKNVVVDSTTGNITFENKPSIPSDVSDLSDDTGIIPIDVYDLSDTHNTAFTPKSHTHTESDITDLGNYAESADFDTVAATITYTNSTTETVQFYIVPTNNP